MSRKEDLSPLEESTWEGENFVHTASVLKQGKTEGISIKTSKKLSGQRRDPRKSFWLQKDEEIGAVIDWFSSTVKTFFSKFWGKEIISQDQITADDKLVDELRDQLRQKELENKTLKKKFIVQQRNLALAEEITGNIHEYSDKLSEFEELVRHSAENNKYVEEDVKRKLKENRWILGLDCEVKAKNKDIDPETEIDLHIETNFGEERIIEVKSPNVLLFSRGKGRYNISKDFSVGLSELVEYLQRTEAYSHLKQRGTLGIDKPIGRLLVGYNLDADQKRLLFDWNFHLSPVIKIITYDELIHSARKELELIKLARKGKEE